MRLSMGLEGLRFLQLGGMPSVKMLTGATGGESGHQRSSEDEVGS
jgi:hypothetical protein